MKKLLLLLLCLPLIGFGQNVNIPDSNFKAYLVGNTAINTNGDTEIQVSEATVFNGTIWCSGMNISDLTGIEYFTALTWLWCEDNQLTSLDVTQNTSLENLTCQNNNITSIDLSSQTYLINLYLFGNNLSSLDLSHFACGSIAEPWIANGPIGNPNLQCIQVDDVNCWNSNYSWGIDANVQYFSINCNGTTDIQEHTTNQQLLKITDILGREVNEKRNTPLFYIYNDGTVEKKIIIE